jgi:hypothetical protein
MGTTYPFEGATRKRYSYSIIDPKDLVATTIHQGGNFLYVQRIGDVPTIIYAGEGPRLTNAALDITLWERAQRDHGATHLYYHRQPDALARVSEQEDLIAKHNPPMNAEDAAAG